MAEQDDNQNYALAVIGGVVALVIALVIFVASWSLNHRVAPAAAAVPQAAGAAAQVVVVEKVYFEVGSANVPVDASEVLQRAADAARAQGGTRVVISGFHDASGDAAANAELAKQRAMAVQHALEANGVEPARLMLVKPEVAEGGGDDREARRVEIRLQ